MLRVTADTNIYISALNFAGLPERFLRLAEAGAFELVISNDIKGEVVKVLRGEKFGWPEREIQKALRQFSRFTECVQPARRLDVIKSDPDDNRILECAEAGKTDYIVTGDKRHILPLGSHAGIPIVTLGDFMRQLQTEISL